MLDSHEKCLCHFNRTFAAKKKQEKPRTCLTKSIWAPKNQRLRTPLPAGLNYWIFPGCYRKLINKCHTIEHERFPMFRVFHLRESGWKGFAPTFNTNSANPVKTPSKESNCEGRSLPSYWFTSQSKLFYWFFWSLRRMALGPVANLSQPESRTRWDLNPQQQSVNSIPTGAGGRQKKSFSNCLYNSEFFLLLRCMTKV